MRIPTSKLMAIIHPTTYPRGSRLCKASKTTYKEKKKKIFLWLGVVLFSLVLILLNTLHGGLTDHISSVKQIWNASLVLRLPSIFHKGFKAFKWNLSSRTLDPKDISFHSEITLTLPTPHPTPDTELVLVLGHQRCTKVCMKNSIPWIGRDCHDILRGLSYSSCSQPCQTPWCVTWNC